MQMPLVTLRRRIERLASDGGRYRIVCAWTGLFRTGDGRPARIDLQGRPAYSPEPPDKTCLT